MPKRKRKSGTSTMVKEEKQNSMALHLVDMEGICSRHTGLSVDYKKPCTAGPSQLCHVCKNTAAWNGFFLNVGLEVREGNCGALLLLGAREGMTTANMATEEEKAQAATLFYWLLTQHRCVVAVTITDDVFGGHEQVLCRALSGSVGKISTLTLLQSSERKVVKNAFVTTVCSMKHLVELTLMIDDTPEQFAKLGSLLRTSSSLKVLRAVKVRTRLDGAKEFRECLYKNKSLSSISLTTGILQDFGGNALPDRGSTAFARYLATSRSLTRLQMIALKHGPEVDVRTICQAVSYNSVLTQLDLGLSTLKEEFAAPIGSFLRSTKILKRFGLTYTCVDESYHRAIIPDPEHLSVPQSYCLRCGTFHVDETNRIKPWIEALLQGNDSLNELRFSMFGFCTLECRAFLNALSENTTLSRVTIHRLGQNASEFCKFLTAAGVMDRVTTDIVVSVAYPNTMVAHEVGHLVNVSFSDLESTLHQVAACHRVTHVQLRITSFLCHSRVIEPAALPLIQLIRKAPALVSLFILVDSRCCSRCWNECAPFFCDSVLHNTAIINLRVELPQNPLMSLLPLADLLQRSPGLCRFMLEPPGPEAFREFVRELSKPTLKDNYNLAFVKLERSEPDLVAEKLIIQNVLDRNLSWATRAADFIIGYANKDTAQALERMSSCPLLVEELCARQSIKKQQALDKIATKVRSMANLNEFMRLAGVVREKIVCIDSVHGTMQLDDLNEYCLRHIRKYLKIGDIID